MKNKNIGNLINISRIAKTKHRLISWAVSDRKKSTQGTYFYPGINTMSGCKGMTRNAQNCYAHLKINKVENARISTMTADDYVILDENNVEVRKKIALRDSDILHKFTDKLKWLFYFDKTEEFVIKIDWYEIRRLGYINKLSAVDNEYVTLDIDNKHCEIVYEKDIPDDYLPLCFYRKFKRPITSWYEGASRKQILVVNTVTHTDYTFDSMKQFCANIIADGQFNVSSEGSIRSIKSQKKRILSKDVKKFGYFEELEGKTMFIIKSLSEG